MKKKILISVCVFVYLFVSYFLVGWPKKTEQVEYGLTWSDAYAAYLGLDPVSGFQTILTELKPSWIRLPAYWSEVEPHQGEYHFDRLKEQLKAMQTQGAKAVIVLGQKQPRWPECWVPDWAKTMNQSDLNQAELTYVSSTIHALNDETNIAAWQIENEPTFLHTYGQCNTFDPAITQQEFSLASSFEKQRGDAKRLIVSTVSGELSTWAEKELRPFDAIGTSVYRKIKTPQNWTLSYWFIPPWIYERKEWLARLFNPNLHVFVSEFQMEPWVNQAITTASIDAQSETLDLAQMKKNLWFAERMDMHMIFFWGSEWWLWMKEKQGHPEFWDTMKEFFTTRSQP